MRADERWLCRSVVTDGGDPLQSRLHYVQYEWAQSANMGGTAGVILSLIFQRQDFFIWRIYVYYIKTMAMASHI